MAAPSSLRTASLTSQSCCPSHWASASTTSSTRYQGYPQLTHGWDEDQHDPSCPLAQAISSFTVRCKELKTTTGTAPGTDIPFSDHEAVMATLHIKRQGQAAGDTLGTAGKVRGLLLGYPMYREGGLVEGLMEL